MGRPCILPVLVLLGQTVVSCGIREFYPFSLSLSPPAIWRTQPCLADSAGLSAGALAAGTSTRQSAGTSPVTPRGGVIVYSKCRLGLTQYFRLADCRVIMGGCSSTVLFRTSLVSRVVGHKHITHYTFPTPFARV